MFLQLAVSFFLSFNSYAQTVVIADGQPHSLSLPGSNGSRGSDGWSGSSATCFGSDHHSKSGGRGHNGSQGHSGGNGGDTIIYYTDISQLSEILIKAPGGRGGEGGRGGSGGRGCNGGFSGSSGHSGSRGFSGNEGKVFLVENLTSLPVTNSQSVFNVSKLENLTSVQLTQKIWNQVMNPAQYLKVGSIVDSVGYQYGGVNSAWLDIVWDAPSSPSDSADKQSQIRATLGTDGKITIETFGETALLTEQSIEANGRTVLKIKNAIHPNAIAALSNARIVGTAPNFLLQITDDKGLSDIVRTKMTGLSVVVKGFIGHRTLFNSDEQYVSGLDFKVLDKNTIEIPLRGIIDTKVFAHRKRSHVNVSLERSYGGVVKSKSFLIEKGAAF